MKESFNYENHTTELKRSLDVGVRCVGAVFNRVIHGNEDVYTYAYYEMKRSTLTQLRHIREALKGI